MDHPLTTVLARVAAGEFPPADGVVEWCSPDDDGTHAVVSFSAHAYILTDRVPDEVPMIDALGGALHPTTLVALAGPDREIDSIDIVLVALGTGAGASLVRSEAHADHPRVARACRHRRDVEVWVGPDGIVTFGSGLVGRTEVSVELTGGAGGEGAGRRLLAAGLATRPAGEAVFAQVAPGNVASVRAFLAAGFKPIGAEALIHPR